MPRGIILSLIICTILYIAVSAILTGMVPYLQFKTTAAPVAYALQLVGYHWGAAAVSVGAICGLTSVLLVMCLGQSRILFVMSRDGLLPRFFGHINKTTKTPVRSSLLVAIVSSILAGLVPIGIVAEMVNIGTLAAFIIVSASVIILRKKRRTASARSAAPAYAGTDPVDPLLRYPGHHAADSHADPLRRMAGHRLVIYFGYGYKHSIITKAQKGTLNAALAAAADETARVPSVHEALTPLLNTDAFYISTEKDPPSPWPGLFLAVSRQPSAVSRQQLAVSCQPPPFGRPLRTRPPAVCFLRPAICGLRPALISIACMRFRRGRPKGRPASG